MSQLPSPVAIVGLGYVGLPLAVALAEVTATVGFDANTRRIAELQQGSDRNGEIPYGRLTQSQLQLTADPGALEESPFIIVAVPTPVDDAKRPDLRPLIAATETVGRHLRRHRPRTVVAFESTVYPGCTEEICVPVLERESGLRAGEGFAVGYSPERINPGDPDHTLEATVKVVAGQDAETTDQMACVYGAVVKAGVFRARDIRTAEAAKVIENIQRDVNIALINELAVLFHRLGLDTSAVLEAARTKWNFLPFEPGLVGGHCIPVDPYYLTHKAQQIGYHPAVILAGRRINDTMGAYVAGETVRLLVQAGKAVRATEVLVLGVAYKPDVRDLRNTGVVSLVEKLRAYGITVSVCDPVVNPDELASLGWPVVDAPFDQPGRYDAVVLAVPHRVFRERPLSQYVALFKESDQGVLVDVKGCLPKVGASRSVLYWRL